jgi:beta-alanine--pyruvate transaminase
MTLAKGITNGAVPMGAVCAARIIHDTVVERAAPGIEFFHGYTYSGHPLAAAAGLATLMLYERDDLFTRSADMAPLLEELMHGLRDCRHVVDVRNIGMVGAVELAARDGAPGARAQQVFLECFRRGVLVRQTGETIAVAPPLVITKEQLQEVVGTLRDVLATVE